MYDLFFEFEAALYDEKDQEHVQRDVKIVLSRLKSCLKLDCEVNFFPRQTSEMEFATGISTTYLQVRIRCQLKQLSNYHHAAQMLQGCFGLFGSIEELHSPVVTIH